MDTNLKYTGKIRIRAWEKQEDGSEILIKDSVRENLLVTVGITSIEKYLGNITGGGYFNGIGVGDSTQAAAVGDTDLVASSNKTWYTIASGDRTVISNVLYVSVDIGYSQSNFTWNEIGLRDNQGTPVLIARVIDSSPLVKTTAKRAIVEWQITVS